MVRPRQNGVCNQVRGGDYFVTIELDRQQIMSFLSSLGKDPAAAKTRAFYPKDNPLKAGDPGRKGSLTWHHMQRWQGQQYGLYLVIGNGGHKDADITSVPALFVEWDDQPRDWQLTAWRELGLPEPSLQVDTAGRSIHSYWITNEPMLPEQWRVLQRRLLSHAKADPTISNPSRVMRLPGSWYINGDGEATGLVSIVHDSGVKYNPADIEGCLPLVHTAPPVTRTIQKLDKFDGSSMPLLELLPRELKELAISGCNEGGRNHACFRLAAVALATSDGATDAGLPVDGNVEQLILDFASRCTPPLSEREAMTCLRSAASHPRTPDPGLQKRIDFHTRRLAPPPPVNSVAPAVPLEPVLPAEPAGPADPVDPVEPRDRLSQIPITCLGFSGDEYFYQSGDSGQVTRITRGQHLSSVIMISLCDLDIWTAVYPRLNSEGQVIGVSWKDVVNDIFRKQHRVGIFDPTRIRGIGAWVDSDRCIFHLGDRLVVDGKTYSVFDPPASKYLYQRLPRKIGPGNAHPLTVEQGHAILQMAERFCWEEPISATLLAGWVALAPICGALQWRPHVWLQAIAGSGKSTVINRFVKPLLSDLRLSVVGATTEAGIRQTLNCDAIPVTFDESEGNLKKDAERIQSVLALARIASSEGVGVTLKGSAGGESTQYNIRSMFFLSSIVTALRQGADESRFCVVTLRVPEHLSTEERERDWKKLEADLIAFITEDLGQSLAARMIRLIHMVREATKVFASATTRALGSARSGDQIGALMAGAWALWNDHAPTEAEAANLIANADWGQQRIQVEESGGDQRRCLDLILQYRLRVEVDGGTLSRTVAELIELADGCVNPLDPISPAAAEAELGRNGLRVYEDRLFVSNTAKGVANMLRDTPWADQGWGNLLGSLPGAVKNRMSRFKGLAQPTRCVSLPKIQSEKGI